MGMFNRRRRLRGLAIRAARKLGHPAPNTRHRRTAQNLDPGRHTDLQLGSRIPDHQLRVWVRGHTDSVKVSRPETLARFPNGNLELSSERALQVAALLSREGGLPWDRLVVAGFGSSLPIADNSTAEGRAANRRIEFNVVV